MPNTSRWSIPYAGPGDAPNGYGQEEAIARAVEKALSKIADPVVLIAHTDGAPHPIGNARTDLAVGVWGSNYISPAAAALGASVSPGGIHVKERAIYFVSGGISLAGSTGRVGAWPAVNGFGIGSPERDLIPASPEGTSVVLEAQPMVLDVDDVVSIIPYQTSGGTINYTSGSLSVTLIGRL